MGYVATMRTFRLLVLVVLCGLVTAPLASGTAAVAAPDHRAAVVPVVAGASASTDLSPRQRNCANGRPTRTFRDSAGDGPRGIDVREVGVWNKDRDACYWFTAAGRFKAAQTQVIRVIIDSDRRYDGYEYEAWAYSAKDRDDRRGAYLIRWTSPRRSHYVSCQVFSAFLLMQGQVRIGIPKTCLGSPAHLRVQVMVGDITRYQSGNRYRALFDFVPEGRYTPLF